MPESGWGSLMRVIVGPDDLATSPGNRQPKLLASAQGAPAGDPDLFFVFPVVRSALGHAMGRAAQGTHSYQ